MEVVYHYILSLRVEDGGSFAGRRNVGSIMERYPVVVGVGEPLPIGQFLKPVQDGRRVSGGGVGDGKNEVFGPSGRPITVVHLDVIQSVIESLQETY